MPLLGSRMTGGGPRLCGRREGEEGEAVAGPRGGEKDAVTSTLRHARDILHVTRGTVVGFMGRGGQHVGTTAKGVKTQRVTIRLRFPLPFHKGKQRRGVTEDCTHSTLSK